MEATVRNPFGSNRDVPRNRWYDFNFHVKWSSSSDGFLIEWLNRKKVLNCNGLNLYAGIYCYLGLANCHAACGKTGPVIHDRVARGSSVAAVSMWTLE